MSDRPKQENWFTDLGSIRDDHVDEFYELAKDITEVLKRLDGRVSYRDLYEIAHQLSYHAVGDLVQYHVNNRQGES